MRRNEVEFHAWDEPHRVLAQLISRMGSVEANHAAVTLLRGLGSLAAVLGASWWTVRQHAGWRVASILRTVRCDQRRALLTRDQNRPALKCRADVQRFLSEFIDGDGGDGLIAVFVDSGLRVIRVVDAHESRFGYDMADVSGLMFKGADLGAAGFFLVHHSGKAEHGSHPAPILILANSHLGKNEDLPLIAQVVIAKDQITFIGGIQDGRHGG